jgi:UDP-N-acetylglucosamine 2-epimerase (non-hydrolysing)/GDP/UDP-N,N'-diacetylbacillosamine 2-epimerase (hydrolysing)
MRKVCVVTGTRAEYGLLRGVMEGVRAHPGLALQLVVTGAHLSPEFGLTVREIEQDGFQVDERVEMLLSSDTAVGVTTSLGLGVIGFAGALDRLKPDLMLVLGDRYEIFAAVQAALVARVPVAHIAGGDTTEGAFDEAFRHGITKMAHLHFVTNAEAARRVRQLGEDPAQIHVVGSPGIDALLKAPLMSREALGASLGFDWKPTNLLITFHPATLDDRPAAAQLQALFDALDRLGPETGLLFTMPNADTEGRALRQQIEAYVAERPHARAYDSLGHLRYLSAMAVCDAVVGNSSSGLYEAPSFQKPTVNIGDRQKGRLKAISVIDCEPTADAIATALAQALRGAPEGVVNPYGDGHAAERIVGAIAQATDLKALLKKRFHLLQEAAV